MMPGMIFGLAESISSVVAGILCKYYKDWHAFIGFCAISIVAQIVFYLAGANEGGSIAFFSLFWNVLGAGGAITIVYIMIELRMPPDKLGSAIVIIITISVFYSSFSPFIAY